MKKTEPEYLMLVGAVSLLTPEEQNTINDLKLKLKDMINDNPDLGVIALTLVMFEAQIDG